MKRINLNFYPSVTHWFSWFHWFLKDFFYVGLTLKWGRAANGVFRHSNFGQNQTVYGGQFEGYFRTMIINQINWAKWRVSFRGRKTPGAVGDTFPPHFDWSLGILQKFSSQLMTVFFPFSWSFLLLTEYCYLKCKKDTILISKVLMQKRQFKVCFFVTFLIDDVKLNLTTLRCATLYVKWRELNALFLLIS